MNMEGRAIEKLTSQTLKYLSTLKGLSDSCLSTIAHLAHSQRFSAGEQIVRHQDPSNGFYVIAAGTVRVSMEAQNGRTITYQLLEPGETFGEVAALDGGERTANVVAESECLLLVISGPSFKRLIASHPDFSALVTSKLVRTNRWLISKLFEYHAFNVKGRVYAELLRQDPNNSNLSITDKDLATRVGTTRENVTRIHKELKTLKVIERTQSKLKILDRSALEALLKDCEFS